MYSRCLARSSLSSLKQAEKRRSIEQWLISAQPPYPLSAQDILRDSDDYMIIILNDPQLFIKWCAERGLISCSKCNSSVKLRRNDRKFVITCSESCMPECVDLSSSKFSYDMTIGTSIFMLCSWYKRVQSVLFTNGPEQTNIYSKFVSSAQEACYMACQKMKQVIGGKGVIVFLERGKRMGLSNPDHLVIGGIDSSNRKKFFIAAQHPIWNKYCTRRCIERYVAPGSVIVSSTIHEIAHDNIKLIKAHKWTIDTNTGCLVEDLMKSAVTNEKYPFDEFVTMVGESTFRYFKRSLSFRSRVLDAN